MIRTDGNAALVGEMALGTETVCPVDMIVGPGNAFATYNFSSGPYNALLNVFNANRP